MSTNAKIRQLKVKGKVYDLDVLKDLNENNPRAVGYVKGRTHWGTNTIVKSDWSVSSGSFDVLGNESENRQDPIFVRLIDKQETKEYCLSLTKGTSRTFDVDPTNNMQFKVSLSFFAGAGYKPGDEVFGTYSLTLTVEPESLDQWPHLVDRLFDVEVITEAERISPLFLPYTNLAQKDNGQIAISNDLKVTDTLSVGYDTTATGKYSVASGSQTKAIGDNSHVYGHSSIAGGKCYYFSDIDFTNKKIYLSNTQIFGPKTEVSGVWKFKYDHLNDGSSKYSGQRHDEETGESVEYYTDISQSIVYSCNGVSYNGMSVYYADQAGVCGLYYEQGENRTTVYGDVPSINGGWQDEAYRTIDFGKEAQTVSAEFYSWLTDVARLEASDITIPEEVATAIVGQYLYIHNANAYYGMAKVAEVGNGYITYTGNPGFNSINSVAEASIHVDDWTVRVPSVPEFGVVAFKDERFGGVQTAEGYWSYATGIGSHAEGSSIAAGSWSHAEGTDTEAGYGSHAEGSATKALGVGTHAEGSGSIAGPDPADVESGLAGQNMAKETAYYTGAHAEGYHTRSKAKGSHAEGVQAKAIGHGSHAEGQLSEAHGLAAHSEGISTKATGESSHAEGKNTESTNTATHAEGGWTKATQPYAHSEGQETKANGKSSHVEGALSETGGTYTSNTLTAKTDSTAGFAAHAEGNATIAKGVASHSEGQKTFAAGTASHAEGTSSEAKMANAHAEGNRTHATNFNAHAEGQDTWAQENSAHAEGIETCANARGSHAEGYRSKVDGTLTSNELSPYTGTSYPGGYAHAEGNATVAAALGAHAEGQKTFANGTAAHAEGYWTTASGQGAHAEGRETVASGYEGAHAEGGYTIAEGHSSHSEGSETWATGFAAHAEGDGTHASGEASHAGGIGTIASAAGQTAIGKYNVSNDSALFIVGDGNSKEERHNAFEIISTDFTEYYYLNKPEEMIQYCNDVNLDADYSAEFVCQGQTYDCIEYSSSNTIYYTYYREYDDDGNYVAERVQSENIVTDDGTGIKEQYRTVYGTNPNSNFFMAVSKHKSALVLDDVMLTADAITKIPQNIKDGIGSQSVAEGENTLAHGDYSHAGGYNTKAYGSEAVVFGRNNSAGARGYYLNNAYWDDLQLYLALGTTKRTYCTITDLPGITPESWGTTGFEVNIHITDAYPNYDFYVVDIVGGYVCISRGSEEVEEFIATLQELNGSPAYNASNPRVWSVVNTSMLDSGEVYFGNNSFVTGVDNKGWGNHIHIEGARNIAAGEAAHAEGADNHAEGNNSHVEGQGNTAYGNDSHAEGRQTFAEGEASHAEGGYTRAEGDYSHSEGKTTIAKEEGSHAEGIDTIAEGEAAHAEGYKTLATGKGAHAGGSIAPKYIVTNDYGYQEQVPAGEILASGEGAFAHGHANGMYVHGFSYNYYTKGTITAEGKGAVALGHTGEYTNEPYDRTWTLGGDIFADGDGAIAIGGNSLAQGSQAIAIGGGYSSADGAISIGHGAESSNSYAIALGMGHAAGNFAIAENNGTANASFAHAEGDSTTAGTRTLGVYIHSMSIDSEDPTIIKIGLTRQSGEEISDTYEEHFTTTPLLGNNFGLDDSIQIYFNDSLRKYLTNPWDWTDSGQVYTADRILSWGDDFVCVKIFETAEETQKFVEECLGKVNDKYYIVTYWSDTDEPEVIERGKASHTEGIGTVTLGNYSHAEGSGTIAKGTASHAAGIGTIASEDGQTVVGKYNSDNPEALFIVGAGSDSDNRKNAFEVTTQSQYDNKSVFYLNNVQEMISYTNNNFPEVVSVEEFICDGVTYNTIRYDYYNSIYYAYIKDGTYEDWLEVPHSENIVWYDDSNPDHPIETIYEKYRTVYSTNNPAPEFFENRGYINTAAINAGSVSLGFLGSDGVGLKINDTILTENQLKKILAFIEHYDSLLDAATWGEF